ncbi:MAG: molybdopterin-binding protein [Pseudomonadota bacterium]
MRFGPVPVAEAEGAILAHAVRLPDRKLKKGMALSGADIAHLQAAGVAEVIVAQLDPEDVVEDDAAARLAAALVPDLTAAHLTLEPAFTGRVNIRAVGPGVVELNAAAIAKLNRVDPMITLATVPQYQRVTKGTMVGTVKIISYGVAEASLVAACEAARGALRCLPVARQSADLIVTEIPGQPASAEDKGVRSVIGRLDALGMRLGRLQIVPHQTPVVADAIAASDAAMILILTGSATSDPRDVAPAAIERAGGEVLRFGMPVDPGNLLVLARIGDRPVLGLPGCARSPALNGADWVLERLACGVRVTSEDIAAMGVGGLLKEIPTRPQPRDGGRRLP